MDSLLNNAFALLFSRRRSRIIFLIDLEPFGVLRVPRLRAALALRRFFKRCLRIAALDLCLVNALHHITDSRDN